MSKIKRNASLRKQFHINHLSKRFGGGFLWINHSHEGKFILCLKFYILFIAGWIVKAHSANIQVIKFISGAFSSLPKTKNIITEFGMKMSDTHHFKNLLPKNLIVIFIKPLSIID